jgi:glycosyltransferase involved in cell wall biosynthesis
MTGVPLVATQIGGTGEVLSAEEAWPVPDHENPAAYVTALREVLADPADARRRAAGLRERMLRERSEAAYDRQVATVLLGLDDTAGDTADETLGGSATEAVS